MNEDQNSTDIIFEDENNYQIYLAMQELALGQFLNVLPEDSIRYPVAKEFCERLISRLESDGKTQFKLVRSKEDASESSEIFRYNIDLPKLEEIHKRLVTKIENPDQKIVADNSLKEVFNLITDLFINSTNIELRPK